MSTHAEAGMDLEAALALAEEQPGADKAPTLALAPDPETEEEPSEEPLAEPPAAEVASAEEAPSAKPAETPSAAAAPRTGERAHQVRTAPDVRSGRFHLVPAVKERLLSRQLAWTAWCALALAGTAAVGPGAVPYAAVVAAALGVGAAAAWPKAAPKALVVASVAVGAVLLLPLLIPGSALISSAQVLVAGAVVGLGLTFLDGAVADRWRRVHGTLGGAAAAGIGWWAATALVGPPGTEPLQGALQGALFGLVSSQALVAAALAFKATDRIPGRGRIRAALPQGYRGPALRARQLDHEMARHAPDPETRDGVGEVAAWIFRLQWSRMVLDEEIAALEDTGLDQRRIDLLERAQQTDDPFTRERLEATARHLAALVRHREALELERGRTAALSEYASAFLEEARAGLAVARVQPGERTPDRLDDVLGRLRSHATDSEARRRTAREVGALA